MGSIIKTYKEDTIVGTGYSTWTLTFIGNDQKPVNGPYFYLESPMTIKAKYTGRNRVFAETSIDVDIVNERCWFHIAETSWASNVEKTIAFEGFVYGHDDPIQTSDIFNETNKDTRIANLDCITELPDARFYLSTRDKDGDSWSAYTKSKTSVNLGGLIGITLDAPPTFEVFSSGSEPYYKNVTPYTVTISESEAQYGGDIASSYLIINDQTAVGSGDGTLSIIPNKAGELNPIVIVEDSRGQQTRHTMPPVIVNDYNAPSILNYRIARCNTDGVLQDDGENAILAVDYSYFNAVTNLKKPITKNGNTDVSATTTWYTTYDSSTGVSNPITFPYSAPATGTMYGVIRSELDKDSSFQISLQLVDGLDNPSAVNIQTLPPTFYTIDFLAGGKGVAFGAPSREEKFKVAMESIFTEKVIIDDDIEVSGNIYAQGMAGMIQMYAGATAPSGWLICDGRAVSRTTYSTLFDVIGTTYGSGDGSTTFNLPDMRDRFPVGAGDTYNEGDTGGYAEVTLTDDEMPAHTHGQKALSGHLAITTVALSSTGSSGIVSNVSGGTGQYTGTQSQSRAYARFNINASHEHSIEGGDQPHENRPPYIGLNFIICTGKTS